VKVTTIILLQLQTLCDTQLTLLTKQPQTYKITTGSNIVTTIKLLLIIPHIAVEIKCYPQQTLVHIISSTCFKE